MQEVVMPLRQFGQLPSLKANGAMTRSRASCRRAARSSAPGGPRTTSANHQTGVKRLRHPVVGELELAYEVMEVPADTGLTISIYTAEPGSRSQHALDLLASWTATPDQVVTPSGDHARED
jgi:hypothetical protein